MSSTPTSPAAGPAPILTPRWLWRTARRQPLGAAAALYLLLLVAGAVLAAKVAPYAADDQNLSQALGGPGGSHLLGTDALGRDITSRLLYGISPSLINTTTALAVFLAVGLPVGIVAGYRGGLLDSIIGRLVELVQALPPIILVLVVVTVFPASATAAMITLGTLGSMGLIRVVRGATFVVREELFVTAAVVAGVRPIRIMGTHILRRVLGPVLVQASLFAGLALAAQAALSFLGILSGGGKPTWGGMTGEAAQTVSTSSWQLIPPGLAVLTTVLAFGLLGDAIRDLTSGEASADGPASASRARSGRTRRARLPHDLPSVLAEPASQTPGDTRGAVLVADDLTIGLVDARQTRLASHVSFSIAPGETVALVGESGCGKSITALALLGMLPGGVETLNGRVVFDGQNLTAGGAAAYSTVRGSGIGYVAQDALGSLDPSYTIGQQLLEVIGCHEKLSRADRNKRAQELLEQVKLPETERVLASYPHQISGGMAQRVNIALALAGRPRLLIADEPTTALDVTVQAEILHLLRDLRHATGLSILIITHDWGVVADIADRAVVMYAGEVVERADVLTLFDRPRFPYTAALIAADPSTAPPGARLPTLPGRVPPPGSWPDGCRFASRCTFVTEACTEGPITLTLADAGSETRCLRVRELVEEGALPS